MSNIQKKAYTSKEILTIAYPILISLVMEQAIGMTDTAFLGRVGEIELGASAIAGVYYIAIFMIGFGFSIGSQILYRFADTDGAKERREEILRNRRYILSGSVFHDFSCCCGICSD